MFGYIAVKGAPPIMRNNEEVVKHAEGTCRHGEDKPWWQ
jgi:hypothetical protein